MELSRYLTMFQDEGREALERLSDLFLKLEQSPDDGEIIHDIFRTIHSFKGMASTMGFANLTDLSHAMENLLDALRAGAINVQPGMIDALLRGLDALGQLLEEILSSQTEETDIRLIKAELAVWQMHTRTVPVARLEEEPEPEPAPVVIEEAQNTFQVDITLDPACMMMSVRALMITSSLDILGQVVSISPSLEELEWDDTSNRFQVLLQSAADETEIENYLAGVGDVESVTVRALSPDPQSAVHEVSAAIAEATVPVAAETTLTTWTIAIELMPHCLMKGVRAVMVLNSLAEHGRILRTEPTHEALEREQFEDTFRLVIETPVPAERLRETLLNIAEVQDVTLTAGEVPPVAMTATVPAAEPLDELGALGFLTAFEEGRPAPKRAAQAAAAARRPATVRVNAERLDALMNLVSELLYERTHLEGLAADAETTASVRRLGIVAADIQSEVIRMRMVPVESVFSRFPRMLRDLGRELGKDVAFQVVGQDTELDRVVVDELSDPLVHLLRNAMDHGFETPGERVAAGKPSQGTLKLSAAQAGNQVVITVSDDGRGIDEKKILAKAVKKGLISFAEGKDLPRQQLLELIFTPGFSTVEEANAVSGRGVGMDVVRNRVQALGGTLSLETAVGTGSTFRIQLPLSMAVVPAMLTDVGGEVYGIPLGAIEDVVVLDAPTLQAANGHVQIAEGDTIPLVRLRERLSIASGTAPGGEPSVVVIRTATQRVGVLVEHVLGRHDVAIKPLSRLLGDLSHLTGAATLGDGRVALILDPACLV